MSLLKINSLRAVAQINYYVLKEDGIIPPYKINFKWRLGLFAKQQFALFFSLLPYRFLDMQVRLWSNGCENTRLIH